MLQSVANPQHGMLSPSLGPARRHCGAKATPMPASARSAHLRTSGGVSTHTLSTGCKWFGRTAAKPQSLTRKSAIASIGPPTTTVGSAPPGDLELATTVIDDTRPSCACPQNICILQELCRVQQSTEHCIVDIRRAVHQPDLRYVCRWHSRVHRPHRASKVHRCIYCSGE